MGGELRELLRELKAGLTAIYGSQLRAVYFYGSYARGDYDEESDLDVLVVLEDFAGYGAEVDRTSALVSALSLEYGVSISQVFVRARDWAGDDSFFITNVRQEAILA